MISFRRRLAQWTFADGMWLVAYLLMVVAITRAVVHGCNVVVSRLSTPEARTDWETWRSQVRNEADQPDRPVARPVPKSTEPPLLVLLRDYFVTCLAAAVFFSSLLFLVTMIFVRGASRKSTKLF